MKKDPSDYTPGEQKYLARQQALKAGKPNAMTYFKNVAVTKAGDFVIGLTYNIDLQRYSCSAIEIDGIRHNDPMQWDKEGGALDDDLSALVIDSVHSGVRTI
ncbi:hypothetical protein ACT3RN_00735 [Psychrobacter sp. AOP5-GZ1-6]|uniref:hypothetical protein n=1 Tax=Psychrobacter sp. AOP5-GZ1-6 TaxID=3457649 RepID=UPI00402B7741